MDAILAYADRLDAMASMNGELYDEYMTKTLAARYGSVRERINRGMADAHFHVRDERREIARSLRALVARESTIVAGKGDAL